MKTLYLLRDILNNNFIIYLTVFIIILLSFFTPYIFYSYNLNSPDVYDHLFRVFEIIGNENGIKNFDFLSSTNEINGTRTWPDFFYYIFVPFFFISSIYGAFIFKFFTLALIFGFIKFCPEVLRLNYCAIFTTPMILQQSGSVSLDSLVIILFMLFILNYYGNFSLLMCACLKPPLILFYLANNRLKIFYTFLSLGFICYIFYLNQLNYSSFEINNQYFQKIVSSFYNSLLKIPSTIAQMYGILGYKLHIRLPIFIYVLFSFLLLYFLYTFIKNEPRKIVFLLIFIVFIYCFSVLLICNECISIQGRYFIPLLMFVLMRSYYKTIYLKMYIFLNFISTILLFY